LENILQRKMNLAEVLSGKVGTETTFAVSRCSNYLQCTTLSSCSVEGSPTCATTNVQTCWIGTMPYCFRM